MIDVVIVNWNAGERLLECVDSISPNSDGLVDRLVVVDNDSSDGSDALVENRPGVTLVRASQNLGFGRACNVGAARGAAGYVLFLNPDAAPLPGVLRGVKSFMDEPANKAVGICGVQLKDEDGVVARSCARFPSAARIWAHAMGLDRFVPSLGTRMAEWNHCGAQEVDQVIGAFFFVRRDLFQQLGGFDERFFVYFEEVDFSLRARQRNWRTVYLGNLQAFHAGGGSSRHVKARRLFYSLRSRLLYSSKHFSRTGAAAALIATLVFEPASRLALALARRSWSGVRETWGGFALLWRWLPQWASRGVAR